MLSADMREKPKAREYRELMDIINRRGMHGHDRYGDLMRQEARVLDTVDRVVNDARLQQIKKTSVIEMSMMEIIARTAEVVHDMYLELFTVRSMEEIKNVFIKQERRVYLGIIVTIIGFLIGFIQLSTTSGKTETSFLTSSPTQHLHSQQWPSRPLF